jgi:hypothetical protein
MNKAPTGIWFDEVKTIPAWRDFYHFDEEGIFSAHYDAQRAMIKQIIQLTAQGIDVKLMHEGQVVQTFKGKDISRPQTTPRLPLDSAKI